MHFVGWIQLYKPVKRDSDDESSYAGNDSPWGTIAGMMEVFHLGFDEVLWEHDYLNLKLLMLDKLHYVGKGKGKKKPGREMTKEEELKMFQELIEKENRK